MSIYLGKNDKFRGGNLLVFAKNHKTLNRISMLYNTLSVDKDQMLHFNLWEGRCVLSFFIGMPVFSIFSHLGNAKKNKMAGRIVGYSSMRMKKGSRRKKALIGHEIDDLSDFEEEDELEGEEEEEDEVRIWESDEEDEILDEENVNILPQQGSSTKLFERVKTFPVAPTVIYVALDKLPKASFERYKHQFLEMKLKNGLEFKAEDQVVAFRRKDYGTYQKDTKASDKVILEAKEGSYGLCAYNLADKRFSTFDNTQGCTFERPNEETGRKGNGALVCFEPSFVCSQLFVLMTRCSLEEKQMYFIGFDEQNVRSSAL